jgi:hypothetical protein
MRNFNVLAAVAAALLIGVGASAKEKTDPPKPRKICRTQELPGRITPRRVCRIVTPSDTAAEDNQRKAGEAREAKDVRD